MKKLLILSEVVVPDRIKSKRTPVTEYASAINTLNTEPKQKKIEGRLAIEMPDGTIFWFKNNNESFHAKFALARFMGGKLISVQGLLTWEPVYRDIEEGEQS